MDGGFRGRGLTTSGGGVSSGVVSRGGVSARVVSSAVSGGSLGGGFGGDSEAVCSAADVDPQEHQQTLLAAAAQAHQAAITAAATREQQSQRRYDPLTEQFDAAVCDACKTARPTENLRLHRNAWVCAEGRLQGGLWACPKPESRRPKRARREPL